MLPLQSSYGPTVKVGSTPTVKKPAALLDPKSPEAEQTLADQVRLTGPVAFLDNPVETTAPTQSTTESAKEPYRAPEGVNGPLVDFGHSSGSGDAGGNFVLTGVLHSLRENGLDEAVPLLKSLGVKPGQKTGENFDPTLSGTAAQEQLTDWKAGQVAQLLQEHRPDLAHEVLSGRHEQLAGHSVLEKTSAGAETTRVFQQALRDGKLPENDLVLDTEDIHFIDTYTTELAREKGYNGLPEVVEPGALKGMQTRGEIGELVYRGQPNEFNDDLLKNPEHKFRLNSGRSTFGPAIYVSTSHRDAEGYVSHQRREDVTLLKMGLKKNARVETSTNLEKMMQADREALRANTHAMIEQLEAQAAQAEPKTAEELKKQIEGERSRLKLKEEMLFGEQTSLSRDYSRYAIHKGYDAVMCVGEYATLAVLNRSALVIESPEK